MNRHFFRSLYLLPAFVFSLIFSTSRAQQPQLSITYINLPDTIYEGAVYDTLYVTITNLGNSPFFDSLRIFIRQDTTNAFTDLLYRDSAFIGAGAVITLPLDSHEFNQVYYKTGGNTVVIWPVGINAATVDSFHTDFYYVILGGFNEREKNELRVYPNPVKDQILLEGVNKPGDVRIYNMEGRVVYDKPFKEKKIEVTWLPPGVYLLEYKSRDKQRSFKKILKL